MRARATLPILAALLGLAGSLVATLVLHRQAARALDGVLEERLRGAGETAAELLAGASITPERLRRIVEIDRLDGAYVVSPDLELVADAAGGAGGPADLLRVDAGRVAEALRGRATVGRAYDVGEVSVETAYFPLRGPDGKVRAALALEAGRAFAEGRASLRRALWLGLVLSAVGALALGVAAARWSRTERLRRDAAERAARGEALARMAASVAHEIRNPLGIIRAAVDLVRERAGARLEPRDGERLADVLEEVGRLRRLTEDFLDLSAERPLQLERVRLSDLAAEAIRGNGALHGELEVRAELGALPPVRADPGRLRQVLANLLANAAQAGARSVDLRGEALADSVRLQVCDDGKGVAADLREKLFDPFATGREGGTGLGLAVSRRIMERHGGTLRLVPAARTTFELQLPRSREE